MVKVRQDAWSHEDDLLLAETVLRHIREGSTQLTAFEEVGDQLNRTAAACGFRWNAEVRQNYEKAVDLAKRQRKTYKKANADKKSNKPKEMNILNKEQSHSKPINIKIDEMIKQLELLKASDVLNQSSEKQLRELQEDNKLLREENQRLQKKNERLQDSYEQLQQDYQLFINMMERARKMMLFDEKEEELHSPAFKMEKNGNLEQLAK
ncbi:RsfA family transcriptional regulator [Halalkalibacillus halophilus]|uniref:RsfA family transcriptional regulator n=1 Tax=Halalkalibacillus halophilus TaxID=392827 RepID=UPI0004243C12|nr:RsfA family transcriptional regulator [Halalkalibacillus halophilus]